jgi:glycosyltransferase involved in cell wall biosynthesis
VASSRGSIPEVVGDTELLFDPEDVDDIADKIEKVLKMNKVDYNKLVKKSLNHAEKFSWEKTARKTIKVLTSIKK